MLFIFVEKYLEKLFNIYLVFVELLLNLKYSPLL